MTFKIKNYMNYIYLLVVLMIVWFLYNRYEDKRQREENTENYNDIQKFYEQNIQNKSLIIGIAGDKKMMDIKKLEKFGKIKIIKIEDVFVK